MKQIIRFRFKRSLATAPPGNDKFDLDDDVIVKFLIPSGKRLELAPGIHFIPMKDYSPGENLNPLFGELISPDGINSQQTFSLESENSQEKTISALYGGITKWPNEGVRRHYKTNIPGLFKSRYEDKDEFIISDTQLAETVNGYEIHLNHFSKRRRCDPLLFRKIE